MNVYQLDTETMKQCRLDTTDADIREENSPFFLAAYNYAYERVIKEKIRPVYTEAVTLDAGYKFNISALTKTFLSIFKITQYQDYTSSAGYLKSAEYSFYPYSETEIIVPQATASGTVYATYFYMPTRLTHKELLFNVKGAATSKTIPVDEAITAAMVDALVGSTISLYDDSAGTYQQLTIASVAIGVAGSATITVSETISGTLTADDIIYSDNGTKYHTAGESVVPQFYEGYHDTLTYWAAHKHYSARGANYAQYSNYWKQMFDDAFGRIKKDYGFKQELSNVYYSL